MSETTESVFTAAKASAGLPAPIADLSPGFFWTRLSAIGLPSFENMTPEERLDADRRITFAYEYLSNAECPTRMRS